jgi:cytochrome c-type biogenesis protein CcmF
MIIETGHFALILALVLALVQSVLPLAGAAKGRVGWMQAGRSAAIVQFLLVAGAFGALMHAYITSDFSVANVAANSHTDKPLLYKISGVWGNHEGSMLLWVLILSLCGAAVALAGGGLPLALRARVLAVQGMVGTGFLLFILLTSNPFTRNLVPPINGQGLNPILQDPGLAFHPPMLYLGYVGSSVAFAFAVAALIEGRVDASWGRWVRPWALASWCALTCGIAMGSWWAYYTLGWGGWWFWDPVENASLMPWLVGTALLHSATVVERREALKTWTVLLAIITFSLSLVGTFLVRSGVLTSVHAFAVDPARGLFILALLIVVIGGSLTLYAWRAPGLRAGGVFAPVSREGALLLNNVLLAAAVTTVFLGTLYPLFLDAIGGEKLTVGPPYFDRTFGPIMVPLLIAMAIGPMLAWKRGDLLGALQRLWIAAALAITAALLVLYFTSGGPILAIAGFALAAWVSFAALAEWAARIALFRTTLRDSVRRAINLPRSAYGTTAAHFGMGILAAGIAATAFQSERIDIARPGQSLTLSGWTLRLDRIDTIPGPNYTADRAHITVFRNNAEVGTMSPERRTFPLQQQTVANTAIRTNLFNDLYIALGEPDGLGGWTLRIYDKPLIPWIWLGAIIMASGGLLSLSDRRWRVGAPARARGALPHAAE